ncbi:MAG: [protein-PII] uridylyltransferase, partial [Amphiplicatus sp.]
MTAPMQPDEKRSGTAPISEALASACERQRAGQSHGEIAAVLKTYVEKRRRTVVAQYARGDVAANRLADFVTDAISSLFREGAKSHSEAARRLTVVAVGGFGRGELAPYSDIDLLFLHPGEETAIRPLLDFILYPLWDAGLKVGHAVHTPASAAEFAQADIVARTAFLDARHICGAGAAYTDFQKRYEKLRKRTKKQFEAAKRAELEDRHEKSEQSRYLAEPDLKEGKGGLRDLHTLKWLYKYEFEKNIDDEKATKRLLAPDDLKALKKCERFLWSVRVQLHGLRGRADEKLSFDVQPALAEKLGYADRGGMPAAERLMKHYFVNAMEVGRLTRIFSAKLEEEHFRLSPRVFKVIPNSLTKDEAGEKANLKLAFGLLHFDNAAKARRSPLDLFRLFRAYARRPDLDIHPDALAIVSASAIGLTLEKRNDPAIAKVFLATLTEAKNPAETLRLMAETGLLGRYIPSFGKIIGRIEYGLYRRYSVDENVFQTVGVLSEIERGDAKERHPIATGILSKTKERTLFYAAALLHETIWSIREGSIESCERLVGRISKRLGLAPEDASLVGWAAAHHLAMVETVERRNLSEPRAVARFAEEVGDRRRLDMLLVLSVCHLRTVGVSSWDDWTRRQLSELYYSASAWLSGGQEALAKRFAERAGAVRAAARGALASWSEKEQDAFLARLSDEMFRIFDAEMIARIGDLARAATQEKAAAGVSIRPYRNEIEATVYAEDRPGLLADLAGAISTAGVSVRSVQVTTTTDGKAIDVFTIQSLDGGPLDDAALIRRLHARLLEAARAAPVKAPTPAKRIGDRRAIFKVPSLVRLDLEASEDCVVVEAEGRDRPGLLYDLTAALADL